MKKFYLSLIAVALGASYAMAEVSEPTLSQVWVKMYDANFDSWDGADPNWNSTDAIKGQVCARHATGINGKLYSVNMKTMSVLELDADGYRDLFKLPSLQGREFSYMQPNAEPSMAKKPDYYGTLMSRDDAGHMLVGHAFTTGAMTTTWTLVDLKTQKAKHFDIQYYKEGELPYSELRIDAVGRCGGDATDFGVMYIAPTGVYWTAIKGLPWVTADNVQRYKMVSFTGEGNDNVEDVQAAGNLSDMIYLGDNVATVMQPKFQGTQELFDLCEEYTDDRVAFMNGAIMYSKNTQEFCSMQSNKWSMNFGYTNQWGIPNLAQDSNAEFMASDMANNWSNSTGFDTFVLQGKRYYVATYISEVEARGGSLDNPVVNNKPMNIGVFDEEYNLVGTVWKNPQWAAVYGYTTITAEPIDDTSVNIYVYTEATKLSTNDQPNVCGAQLRFEVPATDSGIFDATIDNNAPAEYFNLQGVRVANPENGVYIVRKGNTVTKQLVR